MLNGMREDSIDRRLGFLKSDYNRALPRVPLPKERHHGPANNTAPTTAGRPYLKRNVIEPTTSNHRLMRQMSALGMEDPVFGATPEDCPRHPSNIFDDMSIHDVPEDMRDMVSIASDPTADERRGGFDAMVYRTCLGDMQRASSGDGVTPTEFSMMELAIPSHLSREQSQPSSSRKGPSLQIEQDTKSLGEGSRNFDKFRSEARFTGSPNETEQRPTNLTSNKPMKQQSLKQPVRQESKHIRSNDVSFRKGDEVVNQETAFTFPSHSQLPHKHNNNHGGGGGSVTSKTSKSTVSELTEETSSLSLAEKADRLVGPRGKRDRIHCKGTRRSPTKKTTNDNLAEAVSPKHDAPRFPQRRVSTNAGGTMFDAYTQSVQEQYATTIPPNFATSDKDGGSPSIFHRGDSLYQPEERGTAMTSQSGDMENEPNEVPLDYTQLLVTPPMGRSIFRRGESLYQPEVKGTSESSDLDKKWSVDNKEIPMDMAQPTACGPSILHRGDSIYQQVKRAEASSNHLEKEKVSVPNSAKTLIDRGALLAPSTASNSKNDETPAKSRAMPSITNLFPGTAGTKRTRRRTNTKAATDDAKDDRTTSMESSMEDKTTTVSPPRPRTFRIRTTTTACYSIAPAPP